MAIPQYPASRAIVKGDKSAFDSILKGMQPRESEYTFTNLFLWGHARGYSVSMLDGHILVSTANGDFLQPIGPDPTGVMRRLMDREGGAAFVRVSEEVADALRGPGVEVEESRDDFDYVYRRKDLAELGGAKYYSKRSFAEKAIEQYGAGVLEGRDTDIEGCRRLQDQWCEEHACERDTALAEEARALYVLFLNKKDLWVKCVAVVIDGRVAAFAAGEELNDDTFVIHFEKADTRYKGIYQLVNREFAKRVPEKYAYINREQDLGVPGIRKAKESYHPVFMVKKFRVRKA